MCKPDFTRTPLAKQKHAEFTLKIAEIIFGIVLIGALGAPVLYWFTHKEAQTDGTFSYYTALLIAGILGGMYLYCKAIKVFNQPADETENNTSLPIITPSNTASPLVIQIKHGNTHVSINIQQEKNDA